MQLRAKIAAVMADPLPLATITASYLILTSVLLLALSACHREAAAPATLPADWPLSFLKLPADAKESPLGAHGSSYSLDETNLSGEFEDEGQRYKDWKVGFSSRLSWNEVEAHIDSQVLDRGFEKTDSWFSPSTRRTPIAAGRADYESADSEITLLYDKSSYKDYPAFEAYVLSIRQKVAAEER